jgi:hypothetical protein
LKKEKIEGISFCDEDPKTDVESWYVYGEVPKENLEKVKELFCDELDIKYDVGVKKNPVSTCQGMLKIVTNKGKYVVPVQERIPQNNWEEHASFVGVWPRLQKEKIINIGFCDEVLNVDIDSWHSQYVPKGKLDECIRLIDKAMRDADRKHFKWGPVWQGRMKIITDKGKYLVPAETEICNTNSPSVFGNEWTSSELGEYLKKYGFCNSDANQPEQKLSE